MNGEYKYLVRVFMINPGVSFDFPIHTKDHAIETAGRMIREGIRVVRSQDEEEFYPATQISKIRLMKYESLS